MTQEQQKSAIEYGKSIDILVTPIDDCGVLGVDIGKLRTFSYIRAMHELSVFSVLRCVA